MNENKGNDNSPKKNHTVGCRQGWRCKNALNHDYKNNYGCNFQFKKFLFIDFFLTDRRNLSGKRPNQAVASLPVVDFFVLSLEKCHYQSHWKRNFRFFFWYTGFLSLLGKWYGVCKWYGFFSVLPAIIREKFDKLPWIENGESFTVHSSTWPSALKASDVSAAGWRYQIHVKKYLIFSRVLWRLLSGLEIIL